MARAHFVKKARRNYNDAGIKKGESYYWWKFNFSKYIHRSKTAPRRSQLTQSGFLAQLYDIEDNISDMSVENYSCGDDIRSDLDSFIGDIQSLLDECQNNLDNMPEHLQESSSSGETLRERIDALEGWISELESINCDFELYDNDIKNEIATLIENEQTEIFNFKILTHDFIDQTILELKIEEYNSDKYLAIQSVLDDIQGTSVGL